MSSKISHIDKTLTTYFAGNGKQVYTYREISKTIDGLMESLNMAESEEEPIDKEVYVAGHFREINVQFDENTHFTRYLYNQPDIFEIATSFFEGSYISHFPAMQYHSLTTQVPKTIYCTKEQSPKKTKPVTLTQAAIDLAFSKPQRRSESKDLYDDYKITIIKSKHTGRTGVIPAGIQNSRFDITNLERTLIDITVRPNYGGGATQVAEAYQRAVESNLSVNKLLAILKTMDFIYPYHQAIGFYLERAGYKGSMLDRLRKMPMEVNFYLDYKLLDSSYSKDWKLYYPSGL